MPNLRGSLLLRAADTRPKKVPARQPSYNACSPHFNSYAQPRANQVGNKQIGNLVKQGVDPGEQDHCEKDQQVSCLTRVAISSDLEEGDQRPDEIGRAHV